MAADRTIERQMHRQRLAEQQELARVLAFGRQTESVLDELAQLTQASRVIEAGIDSRVLAAREAGHTWESIGVALGITSQGATSRHAAALRR